MGVFKHSDAISLVLMIQGGMHNLKNSVRVRYSDRGRTMQKAKEEDLEQALKTQNDKIKK